MQVVDLPASPISTSSDLYGQCDLPAMPSALSALRMQACYKQPEIGTPISAPRSVPARRITITADSKSDATRILITPLLDTGGGLRLSTALDGAEVLLTGATGFLGSLMLELILRTCPNVHKVKCIVRARGSQSAEARLRAVWAGPVFRRHSIATLQDKVEVIDADLSAPQCGLSAEQQACLASVEYIIHCAASISFLRPIQSILSQNFTPTATLAQLAASLPRLKCFTYMSTAFVNANQPVNSTINEEIYPLQDLGGGLADGAAVAQWLLTMPEDMANRQAVQIMEANNIGNTYFLSKSLTERMLLNTSGLQGRLCIVRPSIVGAVAYEPCPGWVGNTSGFTALILGAASGVIKFTSHNPASVVPLVPGDLVVNVTLAATLATPLMPDTERPIFGPIVHACTSTTNPLGAKRVHGILSAYFNEDRPMNGTLVPDSRSYKCSWLRSDTAFWWAALKHGAYVNTAAMVLRLGGNDKLSRKLKLGWKTWRQLGSRKFDINLRFRSTNIFRLQLLIDPQDPVQLKLLWQEEGGDSWLRYVRTYCAGVRHVFRKEAPATFDQQDYRPAQ